MAETLSAEEVARVAEFRAALRQFLRRAERNARGAGLTPQRYLLLLAVKGAPDRTETRSIGQLSDDLQLAQSSVTELVDRAEAAGLVARATGNSDARTVLVRLEPAGEERLMAALTSVRAEREQLLERLDRARHHL